MRQKRSIEWLNEFLSKFPTKGEARKADSNAYEAAYRRGLLEEAFPEPKKPPLTDSGAIEIASAYKTLYAFRKAQPEVEEHARRAGLWGEIKHLLS